MESTVVAHQNRPWSIFVQELYVTFLYIEKRWLQNSSMSEKNSDWKKQMATLNIWKKLCCNSIINHHHLYAQLIIEKINKNTIIISREQHLFNHESFFVGWVGSFSYFRRVLLVCQKNYWHGLWRKPSTFWQISRHFLTENSSTFCYCFLRATRKHSCWSKIYFQSIRMVFLSPLKKQKQSSDEFTSEIMSVIFVTN